MQKTVVTMMLNQQQLELMDRAIAAGIAPDRPSLVRLALRAQAGRHAAETSFDGGQSHAA